MRLLTIVGARPQFIKASVVSRAIAKHSPLVEVILHTGQHFDRNMSEVFFNQLGLPKPNYLLDIHGGGHGSMTGRMLIEIEKLILSEKPDRVVVYGDTNSTLAGALAAAKLHVPVAHIEAGLRSYNMRMPEEINRILTDQLSDLLFCPTRNAVDNLAREGFPEREVLIENVGDVMQDSAMFFSEYAVRPSAIKLNDNYVLATIHRAENTDDPEKLKSIVDALNRINEKCLPVVLPLHPRTRHAIQSAGLELSLNAIEPVGYLEMIWLIKQCDLVITDSGGLQKEAYFFGKPCVTVREQTEWVELVKVGANQLCSADTDKILSAVETNLGRKIVDAYRLYGGGMASEKIAMSLLCCK